MDCEFRLKVRRRFLCPVKVRVIPVGSSRSHHGVTCTDPEQRQNQKEHACSFGLAVIFVLWTVYTGTSSILSNAQLLRDVELTFVFSRIEKRSSLVIPVTVA